MINIANETDKVLKYFINENRPCFKIELSPVLQAFLNLNAAHEDAREKRALKEFNTPVVLADNIIFVRNYYTPPDFLAKVQHAIEIIKEGEIGRKLISKIGSEKHQIFINYSENQSHAVAADQEASKRKGGGCSSDIHLSLKTFYVIDMQGEPIEQPFWITMAHELIHALHNVKGTSHKYSGVNFNLNDQKIWSSSEEMHTITGLFSCNPLREKPKISENSLRKEHGLPKRYSHLEGAPFDIKHLVALYRDSARDFTDRLQNRTFILVSDINN